MSLRVLALVLALLGALAVVVGAAMVYVPAGVVVAGVEFLSAAYAIGYREARR